MKRTVLKALLITQGKRVPLFLLNLALARRHWNSMEFLIFFFTKILILFSLFALYIYTVQECHNKMAVWFIDVVYKRKTSSKSKQTPLLILFILRQISYILQLQTNFCRLRPISVCNCTVVKNLLIFTIRHYTWSVSSVGHAHSNKLAIGWKI